MKCEVKDFDSIIGIESTGLMFLPSQEKYSFKGNVKNVYPASTVSVRKILQNNAIDCILSDKDLEQVVFRDNHSIDWFGPFVLFTYTAITQNPLLVSMTINLISNYVYDIFKGKSNDPNVKCSFFYTDNKKGKKIEYDGPVSGLIQVNEIINGLK